MTTISFIQSTELLIAGKVIAYPTEAVFGLGCDPNCERAVLTILSIKKRPIEKGLILLTSDFTQLIPFIDETALSQDQIKLILSSKPGPVTWIVPKNKKTPYYLTGQFDSVAVRVTNHPSVDKACKLFGKPLVSTSANLCGQDPCRTVAEIEQQFGQSFPILEGKIGTRKNPSEIRNIQTGQIIRQG